MHFLLPLLFLPFSNALYFYLNAGQSRCFLEELPKDTIVVGHYKAEDWDEGSREFVVRDNIGIQISVTELDADEVVVNTRGLPEGKFVFTSHAAGDHDICLQTNYTNTDGGSWFSSGTHRLRFHLDITIGEAKLDEEHEKGHVTDLATKVKDLNAKIEEIRKEQQFQREREIEFRALSDKANRGAIWWSFIQLAALLGSCAWQLRHLKKFFESKKIL